MHNRKMRLSARVTLRSDELISDIKAKIGEDWSNFNPELINGILHIININGDESFCLELDDYIKVRM